MDIKRIFNISDKTYDRLKVLVVLIMPAFATLIATISGIISIPYSEEIVNILVAVNTFMGTILMISTHNYNKDKIKRYK